MKLKTISLLLCLLLVLPSVGFCSATYQITESQFNQLEANLTKLENLNSELSVNSTASAADLVKALYELKQLKEQLKQLQTETQTAQSALTEANKSLAIQSNSLKQLEQQENKLKRNNVFLQIVTVLAVGYAAIK